MPRSSARGTALKQIRECLNNGTVYLAAAQFASSSDDEEDDDLLRGHLPPSVNQTIFHGLDDSSDTDSDSDLEDLLVTVGGTYNAVRQERYLLPRYKVPKSKEFVYEYFLELPDDRFREVTRLNKEVFMHVVDLIVEDPVFQNDSLCPQAPVHWQLACALDRLGNDGQGVSLARSSLLWGLGHGTIHSYYLRVLRALTNLRARYITWPGPTERAAMSEAMEASGFKGAVGFVDGTLLPLHEKPPNHGKSYWDKKGKYSINTQVICDAAYRIRHLMTGMPGSCNDSGVFANSPLVRTPARFFSPGQYLLGDSAYKSNEFLVRPYKVNEHDGVDEPHRRRRISRFNTYLAQRRVVNEHTIGIWKNRFSSLKNLRMTLRKEGDVVKVIRHVTACAVLHNIAVERDPWSSSDSESDGEPADPEVQPLRRRGRRRLNVAKQKRFDVRRECLARQEPETR